LTATQAGRIQMDERLRDEEAFRAALGRGDAAGAVRAVQRLGLQTRMLSGDLPMRDALFVNERVARALALAGAAVPPVEEVVGARGTLGVRLAVAAHRPGATELGMALSRASSLETFRALLEAGADVHARDRHGFTPLAVALELRNMPNADWLLRAGADVNAVNYAGNSLLHQMAEQDNHVAVDWLRRHGANQRARNRDGLLFTDLLPFMETSGPGRMAHGHG